MLRRFRSPRNTPHFPGILYRRNGCPRSDIPYFYRLVGAAMRAQTSETRGSKSRIATVVRHGHTLKGVIDHLGRSLWIEPRTNGRREFLRLPNQVFPLLGCIVRRVSSAVYLLKRKREAKDVYSRENTKNMQTCRRTWESGDQANERTAIACEV